MKKSRKKNLKILLAEKSVGYLLNLVQDDLLHFSLFLQLNDSDCTCHFSLFTYLDLFFSSDEEKEGEWVLLQKDKHVEEGFFGD